MGFNSGFKGLNAELHPICHLLALLGAHPILHVSRIRVNRNISIFQYGCESFSFVSLSAAFGCKKEVNMRDHMLAAGDNCSSSRLQN